MRVLGILVCVLALTGTGAWGAMLEDFESGNAFAGGVVVPDPDDAGNSVLYVEGDNVAMNLATSLAPGE